ncbi:putative 60S ribosomal protein L5-2 [Monocercomonoides exilis]|uniref:putative 60S ribosomal protein L5-2 n=1 Tax=Monocercomonoides exilis TaxID=2049356 RepID=UPI00355A63CB|nr:putative 60S ribosomal protein L5-2 [Monocercomonoides exilis]KAH7826289.1 putative 60S ribosomal protein L5-2 [Monocercomonoides exilis]KAH7826505.1 putative 60S ribosomal protein L5-2 [Monocercomonoides exilis]|eukprot:MONOS_333.1-p1 / transcript=MONOS_333.1 / gene=MONOS_333 / organism=Monocercomonoides_exilis_PA203 / gene_product=60S ribosomal protein L5-2 / transcript_product=60S ribosomal protein L5-2 / location=Mono_scaffold00005:217575-218495(-) / protein_length=307 / sequence_SO=supercontig / SO=protein_coding / is_pseudo=false
MPLHKIQKDKAYYRRYQVKYRRRREGKTDYTARKALIIQDQRTINNPKHRLVVRITNRDVICQIVMAHVYGDSCMCSAYSHELKRYGIKVGLTNYAACYATGLLLARRLLAKLHLDKLYPGVKEATGESKPVVPNAKGPRPFKAFLDVGLHRTTTGSKVFAVMKGATDGGMNIPHNDKRLVGYNSKTKKLDAAVLREHIFGIHVSKYMKDLKKEDERAYKSHFSQYIKAGITADKVEAMYKSAHAAIRADPSFKPTEKKVPEKKGPLFPGGQMKKWPLKLRRQRFRQKLANIKRKQKSVNAALLDM